MIRAHLATFPPRKDILLQTLASLAPQVDRIFLCLNEYDHVPQEIAAFDNVVPLIPDKNLKDAGKFAFDPAADDLVFTCDDDIIYSPDYVARTITWLETYGADKAVVGYQAHAFVYKKQKDKNGWRNYIFHRNVGNTFKVDILGTGTACFLGVNVPSLEACVTAAGFVDLRISRLMTQQGKMLWTLPRNQSYLKNNLPAELFETSLFRTVQLRGMPVVRREMQLLLQERTLGSGQPFHKLQKTGAV